MIDFPVSTVFCKTIPKTTFSAKLPVTPTVKRIFANEVEKIIWRNKLSPSTLHVQPGEQVTEVQVIEIVLKKDSLNSQVLKIIDKGIPYHLLFLLRHEGRYRACMGYKEAVTADVLEYFQTGWMAFPELPLQVIGLTMDDVYENFIRQIHLELETHAAATLAEAVREELRQRHIQKHIAKLEKQARTEKQPKRKFELVQKIKKIQNHPGD